jgi:Zn-dependent protease
MNNTVYTLTLAIPVLLVAITVHEAMHALTSLWLGDDTAKIGGRISLNPIQHIDPFGTILLPIVLILLHQPPLGAAKPVQINMNRVRYGEYGGAIIAMAGPLSNLVMAVFGSLLIHGFHLYSGVFADILYLFVAINVGFFVFNCIPFPPLDGSRLLYAFAPRPLQEIMDSIEQYGLFAFLIFFLVLYQYLSPVVGALISRILNALLY